MQRLQKRRSPYPPVFKLSVKFVIHTPGPVWHGGNRNEAELLKNCYLNSLALAKENSCRTIAFPCISTGVYHFPKDQAAQIAIETVLSNLSARIEKVIFCCFSEADAEIYRDIYAAIIPLVLQKNCDNIRSHILFENSLLFC